MAVPRGRPYRHCIGFHLRPLRVHWRHRLANATGRAHRHLPIPIDLNEEVLQLRSQQVAIVRESGRTEEQRVNESLRRVQERIE